MFIDKESYFSDGQAVTAEAYGDNALNMVKAGLPIQPGMFIVVQVGDTASDPITSMEISLVTSSTGAFAGEETVLNTKTVLAADLTAYARVMNEAINPTGALQYLNMLYTPIGGSATAGEFDAFIVKDLERQEAIS
jgi:hypothetical protein